MKHTMKLSNGYEIPSIGYGTWQTPDGETAIRSVKAAIESGYRHIDTAAAYNNEESIGEAIEASGVNREELFITSKVWNSERGYEKTIAACEKTLKDLRLDYLDLYLIHWPANKKQFSNYEEINVETWKALETLYKQGKVKAIGVSNFFSHHLKPILENCEIKPMVNQIEYHPGLMQQDVVDFSKENGMLVEAWGPLGNGEVLNNEVLKEIADKYNKSVAQLCIRWALQHEVLPLPKSITPSRIVQNLEVFDFEIKDEDMKRIDALPFCGGIKTHPDEIDF